LWKSFGEEEGAGRRGVRTQDLRKQLPSGVGWVLGKPWSEGVIEKVPLQKKAERSEAQPGADLFKSKRSHPLSFEGDRFREDGGHPRGWAPRGSS